MLIWCWLALDVIVVVVAVFFVPFVISNLTISARVHFCRSRRFLLLWLVQALLQVDTPKQYFRFWMKMRQCVIDECFTDHMLFVNSWYGKSGWRWICHRKASHILWMNYECRELSIIYNANSTLTPKGQPLVWLGSLQYVLRTWQRHIHM